MNPFEVQFLITPIYPEADKRVELGNIISPDDVDLAPDLELSYLPPSFSTNGNTVYTLVLSDPDALSHDNPVKAQMCHWIVTNITLPAFLPARTDTINLRSLLAAEDVSGIIQLKEYFPPSPPPKTGYHRYVFAFLKSNSEDSPIPKKPKKRPHWGYGKVGAGIKEWAVENDLQVVGESVIVMVPVHSLTKIARCQLLLCPK